MVVQGGGRNKEVRKEPSVHAYFHLQFTDGAHRLRQSSTWRGKDSLGIQDRSDYFLLNSISGRVHSVKHLLDCLLLVVALYGQVRDTMLF